MIVHFALLAAAAAAAPSTDGGAMPSARAEARVAVRIVSGARIAAGETQDEAVPALSDSLVRTPGGTPVQARLVEFH